MHIHMYVMWWILLHWSKIGNYFEATIGIWENRCLIQNSSEFQENIWNSRLKINNEYVQSAYHRRTWAIFYVHSISIENWGKLNRYESKGESIVHFTPFRVKCSNNDAIMRPNHIIDFRETVSELCAKLNSHNIDSTYKIKFIGLTITIARVKWEDVINTEILFDMLIKFHWIKWRQRDLMERLNTKTKYSK